MKRPTNRDKNGQNRAAVMAGTMTLNVKSDLKSDNDNRLRRDYLPGKLGQSKGSRLMTEGCKAQVGQGCKTKERKVNLDAIVRREYPGVSYVSLFLHPGLLRLPIGEGLKRRNNMLAINFYDDHNHLVATLYCPKGFTAKHLIQHLRYLAFENNCRVRAQIVEQEEAA